MKYPELREPCKSAIASGRCLGCNKLELERFTADPNCKYIKPQSAQQSIDQIFRNLGVERK